MKADLKTVARAIDATQDTGRAVAIKYVKSDGSISTMLVNKVKRTPITPKAYTKAKPKVIHKSRKDNALLQVQDALQQGQLKTVTLWGIIAWNPAGKLDDWHSINRGS